MNCVREGLKTPTAALAVLLVAFGLAACGGGDDSGSTAAEAGGAGQSGAKEGGSSGKSGEKGGKSKAGSGGEGQGGGSGSSGSRSQEASHFKPKSHDDSGGGSKQFVQKGGDNSVQEFGKEADTQEFEAAAVALHNFLDARAEGNWAAACEYLSKAAVEGFEKLASQVKQIKDTSCAGVLEKLTNPAAKASMKEEAQKANVGSLRTDGDRSFVIYTGIDGTILAMPMNNEDGEWKVSSLAGTPLN
jgi:hypothetical protein